MNGIEVRNLYKSYEKNAVLRGVSLDIPLGQVTCLTAPSGSGKTTLLRILLCLEKADSGSVAGMEGLRAAAVFQEDRLIEQMDAFSNVLLACPALSMRTLEREMAAMQLSDCGARRACELSGGMRRRVALLRALLSEWDFLALDEPFGGLDEDIRNTVMAQTLRLIRGRTVLLVTHDLREAEGLGARVVPLG